MQLRKWCHKKLNYYVSFLVIFLTVQMFFTIHKSNLPLPTSMDVLFFFLSNIFIILDLDIVLYPSNNDRFSRNARPKYFLKTNLNFCVLNKPQKLI